MSELLVHLHIYYNDQVDYFIEKLKNINDTEWDLIVTFSEKNEETIKKLKSLKPDVNLVEVENFGYDIWPFIKVVKSINLNDYKYIIKLHTKREVPKCRPNIITLRGLEWRNALVDGVLYNSEHFRNLINRFRNDEELGMAYSLLSSVSRDYYDREVKDELSRLGLNKRNRYACMGTMFMMRTDALKPLQSDLVTEEMFRDHKPVSGSFLRNAHLYERVFSHLPANFGYKYLTTYTSKKDFLKIKLMKGLEPIGKFIFCCEREGTAHKKFIRILGIRVYEEKEGINPILRSQNLQ